MRAEENSRSPARRVSNRPAVLVSLVCSSLCGVTAFFSRAPSVHAQSNETRPNIVLIMADDMGFECVGANGGTSYETPRLDELARTGMRFENCHSQPICTPSRVQLMTGIFLVYYPMILPHWPFEPTPDSADWDPMARGAAGKGDARYFADMVASCTPTVGSFTWRAMWKSGNRCPSSDSTTTPSASTSGWKPP